MTLEKQLSPEPNDVYRIFVDEREFILVGTAHISSESANLVKDVIKKEDPDCVCVELDKRRYKSLLLRDRWDQLDLKEIIRTKQVSAFFVQILLSSFQKKLGNQTGVIPGTEMLTAISEAERTGIQVHLCDRDVRITLKRVWRSTPFSKKALLIAALIGSLFDRTKISEKELKEIRQLDVLSELLNELSKTFPSFKKVLIDERDEYLAMKIRQSTGDRIVAVVGAGHIQGILQIMENDITKTDLSSLEWIPPQNKIWNLLAWLIPIAIILSLLWIGYSKGSKVAGENAIYWILANGIPTGIGALFALAHPLTVLIAFLSAPFTSLSPLIGVGYVAAFVQVWLLPPRIFEIRSVADDIQAVSNWWKNRLLRILLVFFLTGIGSMIGTWVGGIEILKNLF